MLANELVFDLPERLIATEPVEPRSHARLMVIHRATGHIEHARFDELKKWIHPQEDLLILNRSKVIPARIFTSIGEMLLIKETSPLHWHALGKNLKVGKRFKLCDQQGNTSEYEGEIMMSLEDGTRVIRFFESFDLNLYGAMPLPPYILKRRQAEGVSKTCDDEWYQTVYAQEEGSVAAPTAGLHFTRDLLEQFNHAFLTLHVGLGTFRPIKTKYVEEHVMHEEEFLIPEGLAEKAKQAKRVVSVGTTTVRVLETKPSLMPEQGKTDIYIYPPYKFKRVDALITNFHLPHSTLLLLVAAFMGKELLRQAYAEAIERDYRFYSYGDAMLIL